MNLISPSITKPDRRAPRGQEALGRKGPGVTAAAAETLFPTQSPALARVTPKALGLCGAVTKGHCEKHQLVQLGLLIERDRSVGPPRILLARGAPGPEEGAAVGGSQAEARAPPPRSQEMN